MLVLRELIVLLELSFEFLKQFATENGTEHFYRIKVFALMTDIFEFTSERKSCCRNNTMNVRMQTQVLSPGMQYTNSSGFHTIMGITKVAKRRPDTIELGFVKSFTIKLTDFV